MESHANASGSRKNPSEGEVPHFFISYRRIDREGEILAHTIARELRRRYGPGSVFLDVDLSPGLDFRKEVDRILKLTDIVLVVIGPLWLQQLTERLEDETDWVRYEIAESLKRDCQVVPICGAGVQMPHAKELPNDLKDLAWRQARNLNPTQDFDAQLANLLSVLEKRLDAARREQEEQRGANERAEAEARAGEAEEKAARERAEADADVRSRKASAAHVATAGAHAAARHWPAWREIAPYAALSLGSLLGGLVLMGLWLRNPDFLPRLNLAGKVYSMAFVPLALAAAGFVYGTLRSFALYHRLLVSGPDEPWATARELWGPVVAFAGVLLGGLLFPPPPTSFPLTIYVHGESGPHELLLRGQGAVLLDLEGDHRGARIGQQGQAYFPEIPVRLRGREARVELDADGYELIEPARKYRLQSSVLYLAVRKKSPSLLRGLVQDTARNPVAGAAIAVAGFSATSDASGRFAFAIPESLAQAGLPLRVVASGYLPWDHPVVLGENAVTVTLTPRPSKPRPKSAPARGTVIRREPRPTMRVTYLSADLEIPNSSSLQSLEYLKFKSHSGRVYNYGLVVASPYTVSGSITYRIPPGATRFKAFVTNYARILRTAPSTQGKDLQVWSDAPCSGPANGWRVKVQTPAMDEPLSHDMWWNYDDAKEIDIPVDNIPAGKRKELTITVDPMGDRTCDHSAIGYPRFEPD